ncbi:hypothetical protein C4D60_Mb05t23830 [Musa balbisiana]|uniref:Uncharacterized protein n=1 Tax=Musa balbisiana TaxID=52838 RepID=A0A4S8JYE5_MUSBA|nr:hypothetical protein C4D60_Mb05t23830 [Musa balbisiana]
MNRKLRIRRKPTKRRRRRGFAQAVVDYTASDCYIYAAVLDPLPPDSSPSSAAPSPSSTEWTALRDSMQCAEMMADEEKHGHRSKGFNDHFPTVTG